MNAIIPNGRNRKLAEFALDRALVSEAERLGVDLSQACEQGLRNATARQTAPCWQTDNAEALDASNAHAEQHGLPLAGARVF
jgi:antitoxin CcdA